MNSKDHLLLLLIRVLLKTSLPLNRSQYREGSEIGEALFQEIRSVVVLSKSAVELERIINLLKEL